MQERDKYIRIGIGAVITMAAGFSLALKALSDHTKDIAKQSFEDGLSNTVGFVFGEGAKSILNSLGHEHSSMIHAKNITPEEFLNQTVSGMLRRRDFSSLTDQPGQEFLNYLQYFILAAGVCLILHELYNARQGQNRLTSAIRNTSGYETDIDSNLGQKLSALEGYSNMGDREFQSFLNEVMDRLEETGELDRNLIFSPISLEVMTKPVIIGCNSKVTYTADYKDIMNYLPHGTLSLSCMDGTSLQLTNQAENFPEIGIYRDTRASDEIEKFITKAKRELEIRLAQNSSDAENTHDENHKESVYGPF